MPHKYLLKEFDDFARSASNAESLMQYISQRIHTHIPRYNWIGFYLIDKNKNTTLVLGPYTGSFTPNAKISMDQGLCGAAASSCSVTVADDVAEDPRYLEASDLVKSQISVPVMVGGRVVGVFNVESYFMSAFRSGPEREFVEACARVVGKCLERTLAANLLNV
jgi:L-methionine (R)-S-oxide reductase